MTVSLTSDKALHTSFCPICNTVSHFLPMNIGVDLFRCPKCDHCFTNVSNLESPEQYNESYYLAKHANWFQNPNFKLFEYINQSILKHKPNARILDVGCGKGDLLRYLFKKNKKFELFGIDFTSNAPFNGIHFTQGNVFDLDEDNKFDTIVSLAVIEHIEDVTQFIKKLYRLIKPGGLLILMTVNDRSFLYSLSRVLNNTGFSSPAERLYEKHHVNHFNRSSLKYLVESHGFKLVKSINHNTPLAAVDFEANSKFFSMILKVGVAGIFSFATLINKGHLQTLVCTKKQ